MNVVKDHFHNLANSYLDRYVLRYARKDIDVGILQTCINVHQMVILLRFWGHFLSQHRQELKPQKLHVSESILFNMEYCTVGHIKIDVPWNRIRSRHTLVNVSDVHFVLMLSADSFNQESLSWLYQQKMVNVEREERQLLGLSSNLLKDWSEGIFSCLYSENVVQILESFSLNLTSAIVSILIPLRDDDDLMHARVSIGEITISTIGENSSSENLFRKSFDCRHVSVQIHRVKRRSDSNNSEYFQNLRNGAVDSLIWSPFHIDTTLAVENQRISVVEIEETNEAHLFFDVRFSNIELTPTTSQLELLSESLNMVKLLKFKHKCARLRPLQLPRRSLKNASAWWKYATAVVCCVRHGNSAFHRSLLAATGKRASPSAMRQEYLTLYRDYLECKIRRLATPKLYVAAADQNSASGSPCYLPSPQAEDLERLHRDLTYDDIVTYRLMVHRSMRQAGVSSDYAMQPFSSTESIRVSLFKTFSELLTLKNQEHVPPGTDDDILALVQEIKDFTSIARKKRHLKGLDISLSLPRLAVSWRQADGLLSARASSRHPSTSPAITLVAYGLSVSYGQSDGENEENMKFHLGALRVYGLDSVPLVSCGIHVDTWLNKIDVSESKTDDLALSLRVKWYTMKKERVFTSSEELLGSPLFAMVNCYQHIVLEAVVAKIMLCGDMPSLQDMRDKCCCYTETWTNFFQWAQGPHDPCQIPRQMCAQRSMSKSINSHCNLDSHFPACKLSVDVRIKGIDIELPLKSPNAHLKLSFGNLSAVSGDFSPKSVSNKSDFRRTGDNDVGNREVWANADRSIGIKLKDIRDDLVHSIVFGIFDVDMAVVATDGSKAPLTKTSLNVKGLASFSKHRCHTLVPDLSVDAFASSIDLECRLQDLLDVWDAFPAMVEFPHYWLKSQNISVDLPRMRLLSDLCTLHSNFKSDGFTMCIVTTNEVQVSDILARLLHSFKRLIKERGTFSRVAHTMERLLYSQCRQLGMDMKAVEMLIRAVIVLACDQQSSSSLGTDSSYPPMTDEALLNILRDIYVAQNSMRQPVVNVVVQNISLSCCYLTYDKRFIFQSDEVLLCDRNMGPLIRVFGIKKEEVRGKRTSHGSADDRAWARREEIHENDFGSLLISCTLTDDNFEWGTGGVHIREMSPCGCKDDHVPVIKSWNSVFRMVNLDVVIDPNELMQLLSSFSTFLIELNSLFDYCSLLINIKTSVLSGHDTLKCTAECLHIVCSSNEHFLAEWCVRDLEISNHACPPDDTSVCRKYASSLSFTAASLELHDLTPAGSLHPTAVSKASRSTYNRVPMAVGKLVFHTDESIGIELTLAGVQLCILSRFFDEVLDFTVSIRDRVSKQWKLGREKMSTKNSSRVPEKGHRHRISPLNKGNDCFSTFQVDETLKHNIFGHYRKYSTQKCSNHAVGVTRDSSESTKGTSSPFWQWHIEVFDSVFIFPRNSASEDLIAVVCREICFDESVESESWKPPGRVRMRNPDAYLYFDTSSNEWKQGGGNDDEHACSMSSGSMDTEIYSAEESKYSSDGQVDNIDGVHASAVSRLFGFHDFDEDRSVLASDAGSFREEDNETAVSNSSINSSASSTDEYDFQDALDLPMDNPPDQAAISIPLLATPCRKKSIAEFKLTDSHQVSAGSVFRRKVLRLSGVKLFSSLSGPLDLNGPSVDPLQLHHRRFVSISHGTPVYSVMEESGQHSLSEQKWCQLSVTPTDMLAVCDFVDGKVRILISESIERSAINLKLSISQYFLLLSIVLDNGCEEIAFAGRDIHQTSLSEGMRINMIRNGLKVNGNRFRGVFPEYGSTDFCEHIRSSSNSFELTVVRSDIQLECSMHADGFACAIPSSAHLPKASGNQCGAETNSFAVISLKWVCSSCYFGTETRQIGIGIGDISIVDLRDPTSSRRIVSMALPSQSLYHGYDDLDYGLKHLISELCCGESLDIPIKVSFFAVGNSWRTVNCGLAYLNTDLSEFGIVLLLNDYFSLFFRNKEFGNPAVAAQELLGQSDWPYSGVDFRVFMFKPHFQVSEMLGDDKSSRCVFVEAGGGTYFRLMVDSNYSVRTELHAHDIAVVLMQTYKPPAFSRGIRGTAGSGRGIKSVLEFMNFEFSYHVNQITQHVDIQVSIAPAKRNDKSFELMDMKRRANDKRESTRQKWKHSNMESKSTYVNFDNEILNIPAVTITTPKCNLEVQIPPRKFARECCSIVASYEDMVVASALVANFLSVPFTSLNDVDEGKGFLKDEILNRASDTPLRYYVFVNFKIDTVKVVIVDNVLGLHLPLFQGFLSSVGGSLVSLPPPKSESNDRLESSRRLTTLQSLRSSRAMSMESTAARQSKGSVSNPLDSKPRVHVVVQSLLWTDYFNNMLKCWEPLFEPISSSLLYGQNPDTGKGATIRVFSDVHMNISVSMLRALDDAVNAMGDALWKTVIKLCANEESDRNIPPIGHLGTAISSRISSGPENEIVSDQYAQYPDDISDMIFLSSANEIVDHVATVPLHPLAKVWEEGHRVTCQYLQHEQRGLLNFIASNTLIRDNEVVEESFSHVKNLSHSATSPSSTATLLKQSLGHQVALQIAGYQWLRAVQADTLGIRFEDLHAVIGMLNLSKIFPKWQIQNALKLVAEVRPLNGGRMLQLSSTFIIKNMTKYPIKLLLHEKKISISEDIPFFIRPGDTFHVPLAFLYRSVLKSNGVSLGFLWLAPGDMSAIVDELGVSSHMISGTSYTTEPVDLMDMVNKTSATTNTDVGECGNDYHSQLSCQLLSVRGRRKKATKSTLDSAAHASELGEGSNAVMTATTRIINADNLPKFSYIVEMESVNHRSGIGESTWADTSNKATKDNRDAADSSQSSIYSIVIHAPIIIENMLPVRGTFELVHATLKSVLWSAVIEPLSTASIHTVSLHDPILLLINLDFCRSSEGALIHKPATITGEDRGLAETVLEGFKGLLDDNHISGTQDSIVVTDSVGQRLRLQIENKQSGGGNRKIAVYCPYWVVNSSQYSLRLREDGAKYLPAGTVTAKRDGRAPVFTTSRQIVPHDQHRGRKKDVQQPIEEKIFPGRPGPLHSTVVTAIPLTSPLRAFLHDLRLEQILEMSSMFNFTEPAESRLIGSQKVIAQLEDSNWSSAFTLESAGVNQVLSVDHGERGMLELAFKVYTAPGRLSNFTKIVRFSPRFVVVNKLDLDLKIIQVNGFLFEKIPITIASKHLRPFHLPAAFGERQVAIDISGPWLRSVGFDIDRLGSFSMRIRRTIDTSRLEHILTRGTSEYEVVLPPGEVGIWFETDWGNEQVVVKRIRPDSVAATRTDVQAGDVLLAINDIDICKMDFEEVMGMIKDCQSKGGCRLTFQTIEEKMRLLRENAMEPAAVMGSRMYSSVRNNPGNIISDKNLSEDDDREIEINVELRAVDLSIFLSISKLDLHARPEYRVINRSPSHILHFRQKGISSGRWALLGPGESSSYIFEDPTKRHDLLLRTGKSVLCLPAGRSNYLAKINDGLFSRFSVTSIENHVTLVPMDEIGVSTNIPMSGSLGKMRASVESNGPTKVLIVASDESVREAELKYCVAFICEQISALNSLVFDLETNREKLLSSENIYLENMLDKCFSDICERQQKCQRVLLEDVGDSLNGSMLTCNNPMESLLGPTISKTNSISVQIVEATGLKSAVLGGTDETYCEIEMKVPHSLHRKSTCQRYSTYLNDQTLDPSWVDQFFSFDVPVLPSEPIRGYYIRIVVRGRSIVGEDSFLGQADIPFSCLLSETELFGWFPLKPKKYSIRSSPESLRVTGSIKIRIQWIHSLHSLLEHIVCTSKRRIEILSSLLDLNNKHLGQILKLGINLPKKPQQFLRATSHDTKKRSEAISPWHNKELALSSTGNALSSVHNDINEDSKEDDANEVASSHAQQSQRGMHYSVAYSAVTTHERALKLSLQLNTHLLSRESLSMKRNPLTERECLRFLSFAEYELSRNFEVVRATRGKVQVTPIRALNIPPSTRPLFAQISYGDQVCRTREVVATDHNTYAWVIDEDNNEFVSTRDTYSTAPSFHIDTQNIRGTIGVCVASEWFGRLREYAHVEIPIFEILDAVCAPENDQFSQWFCLETKRELSPPIKEVNSKYASDAEGDMCDGFKSNGRPCIFVSFKWVPEQLKLSDITTQKFHLRVNIPSLSVAMIDSKKVCEILQFFVSGIDVRHSDAVELTETSVNLSWLQVDNQLPDAAFPVILSPTTIRRPQPVLRMHIRRNNLLCHEHLQSFDQAILILQELDLHIEKQTIIAIWDIVESVAAEKIVRGLGAEETSSISQTHFTNAKMLDPDNIGDRSFYQSSLDDDKIYCDYFYIAPILIHVSFIASGSFLGGDGGSDEIRRDSDNFSAFSGSRNIPLGHSSPISLFLWQVGAVVMELPSSILDATIELHGMTVDNMFKTMQEVASILQEHYLNSTLGQVYRIVGSLDLVSNPVGLLSSLGNGVRDFFFEPAHALITNPTEISKIGGELMKGAFSLARSTADGVLGTATIMTRSVGRGVAILAMDDAFLQNREKLNKHPKDALGFVLRPVQDIGNGIYCGVVGIVRVPYVETKRHGLVGFVSGLGKGLAGVATKPIVGILDSVTHVVEGCRYAVKSIRTNIRTPAERRRYCSVFGPDGRLLPYSYASAYGSHVLRMLENVYRAKTHHGVKHQLSSMTGQSDIEMFGVVGEADIWRTSLRRSFFWDHSYAHMTSTIEMDASSNFTLARARRRSISDPGTDFHHIESVIHAAVFPSEVGPDLLVIVTSLRIVVAAHRRHNGDSYVGIKWQCRIKRMAPPAIWQDTSRAGEEVLKLERRFAADVAGADSGADSVQIATSDSRTLHNLYNCLNIVLGSFENVEESAFDMWYEDERSVIHVGPWQFQRRLIHKNSCGEDGAYCDQLEKVEWKVLVNETSRNPLPEWLAQDRMLAINAHANIPQLIEASLPSSQDNYTISMCKSHLQDGRMTAEEFSVFMEKEKLYGHNMHQSDVVEAGLDAFDGDITREGPKGMKRSSSALKKLRNTVRRTISLFTPSSDSIHHGTSEEGKSELTANHSLVNEEAIDVSPGRCHHHHYHNPSVGKKKGGRIYTLDSSVASSVSEVSAEEALESIVIAPGKSSASEPLITDDGARTHHGVNSSLTRGGPSTPISVRADEEEEEALASEHLSMSLFGGEEGQENRVASTLSCATELSKPSSRHDDLEIELRLKRVERLMLALNRPEIFNQFFGDESTTTE